MGQEIWVPMKVKIADCAQEDYNQNNNMSSRNVKIFIIPVVTDPDNCTISTPALFYMVLLPLL